MASYAIVGVKDSLDLARCERLGHLLEVALPQVEIEVVTVSKEEWKTLKMPEGDVVVINRMLDQVIGDATAFVHLVCDEAG